MFMNKFPLSPEMYSNTVVAENLKKISHEVPFSHTVKWDFVCFDGREYGAGRVQKRNVNEKWKPE